MKFQITDACGIEHEMDTENWGERFINIDCMEVLRRMPDKCADLCIVDPPYGIGAGKPSVKPCTVRQRNGKNLQVKSLPYARKDWDENPPSPDYFNELFRVSKNQIIWGINYFKISPSPGRIVWDKLNGETDQMGCETAYNSLNNRTDIVRYMWSGMFQGIYCGFNIQSAFVQQGNKKLNEQRIHPTQKPIALYKWLLSNYAKSGDKILDTHVGSASSLIACHQMGFTYWGFELDTDYYNAATERLNKVKAQVSMAELVEKPTIDQIKII